MDRLFSMQVFCQVIDHHGFAAAARSLDLSPSVVTRAVADLEQHLGVRLLNRSTRRLSLTETGEQYLEQARRILRDVDDAEGGARDNSGSLHGHLKVLASPAFASHQLARDLVGFHQRHPGVKVSLTASGMVQTLDERFDLSIVTTVDAPLDGLFVARPLARSKTILCASPQYLDRHGRPESPEDFFKSGHELMVMEGVRDMPMRHELDGDERPNAPWLAQVAQKAFLTTNHLNVAYAGAVAGLGVAVLPSYVAAQAMAEGRLERVLPQWYFVSVVVYAAMPSRKHVPLRTRALLDYLVERYPGGDDDPWLGSPAALGDGSACKPQPRSTSVTT